ncbi:hypothetical protein CGRA01v4_10291 [Colletotrichum graminicola]|nr:hypothetical protein CGRA01v4_10291 [Colletotrichum graminicola]
MCTHSPLRELAPRRLDSCTLELLVVTDGFHYVGFILQPGKCLRSKMDQRAASTAFSVTCRSPTSSTTV